MARFCATDRRQAQSQAKRSQQPVHCLLRLVALRVDRAQDTRTRHADLRAELLQAGRPDHPAQRLLNGQALVDRGRKKLPREIPVSEILCEAPPFQSLLRRAEVWAS